MTDQVPDEIVDACVQASHEVEDLFHIKPFGLTDWRVFDTRSQIGEFRGTHGECVRFKECLAMRAALSVFAAQMGIKINDFASNDWMEVIDPDHPDCGHKGQVIRSIGPDSTVTIHTTIGTYNADQVRKVPAPKEATNE